MDRAETGQTPKERHLRYLLRETKEAWPTLGLYERFEQAVALVLTFLIACVVAVATVQLVMGVGLTLVLKPVEPLEHGVFQNVFGMIMTVLIALEFNHTILGILHRKDSIVQLRTVILIALLAMARKFVVIETSEADPLTIIGLAAAVLALGAVYWLVREQDRRQAREWSQGPARE
ncbi:MAG TPA: phosphate-starvation-inducible PsiE family protein [Methylocella sp.]|nr:phosphate-starvation-inducible PsiE family protein [Methylocella sp.]